MSEDMSSVESLKKNIGGMLVVILITTLVTFWMGYQKQKLAELEIRGSQVKKLYADVDLTKFRKEALYLPKDYMLGFVKIPSGRFVMGSDPLIDFMAYSNERWSRDKNQADVYLNEYYISQYEVTVAQYAQFVAATGYPVVEGVLDQPGDYPVSNVSWADALAYCRWLEKTLPNNVEYPADIREMLNADWHFSLPNEAQWEKAARGLTGNIYPWGNELDQLKANFNGSGKEVVGSRHCSECSFGLSDMSGNVWEFTRSPFLDYPFSADIDKTDLNNPALWVMRGGSYSDRQNNIRAAVRGGVAPGERRPNIGFRIVLNDFKTSNKGRY